MSTTRKILAGAALGLVALTAGQQVAHASVAPPAPHADAQLDLSDSQDVAAGKCRWVRRIGVVCETRDGTITL